MTRKQLWLSRDSDADYGIPGSVILWAVAPDKVTTAAGLVYFIASRHCRLADAMITALELSAFLVEGQPLYVPPGECVELVSPLTGDHQQHTSRLLVLEHEED